MSECCATRGFGRCPFPQNTEEEPIRQTIENWRDDLHKLIEDWRDPLFMNFPTDLDAFAELA
jgi:hypothetical protein